jgi:hypothetical protein
MTTNVYPYLRPPAECLTLGPWRSTSVDGTHTDLPTTVGAWDYQTHLHLRRDLRIDLAAILRHAHLPQDSVLACACEWTAASSLLSGMLCSTERLAEPTHTLSGRIAGTDLGGSLTLRTAVIVANDITDPRPFTASYAGQVLIDDVVTIDLETDDAMFPVSVCDFPGAGLDPQARWYLQTPSDPELNVMGGLRLYLNAADTELVNAAVRAAAPTPTQQRLLDEMHRDVARQLVDLVLLRQEWIDALPACSTEPDSFGASLAVLLETLFPGEPHQTLAAQRTQRPGDFAARLQAALRRTRTDGAL